MRRRGKIPRDVKYTLVEVLKKDLTEIMVMIYRAMLRLENFRILNGQEIWL